MSLNPDDALVETPAGAQVGGGPGQGSGPAEQRPRTIIEPVQHWEALDLRELWRYRDLFWFLVWREVTTRQRQSVAGIAWAVIRPLATVAIFTFVFGRVAGIKSDGVPYSLFALAGLTPWLYFSSAVLNAVNSVSGSGALVQKVYFPRLLLPLTGIVAGLIDLVVHSVLLAVLMLWHRQAPGWQVMLSPVFLLLGAVTSLSLGVWLAALNVKYRDVGQVTPFLVQALLFLSPVIYPSSSLPEHLRFLYDLNPLVGVIEGFRWSILGTPAPDWGATIVSTGAAVLLLISGLVFFRRTEATFADIL